MIARSFWRDPWVWGVVALALAWRLLYLVDLRATPFFAAPQMDALYHDQWARRLAAGDWWGSDVFFRAPLYPYFLGVLYALFGPAYLLVRIVQFLIGAGTVLLLMRAAAPRFGRAAALLAGAFLAVYGPVLYFEGELLLPVLEAPLFLVTAWTLARAMEHPTRGRWPSAGLVCGLAALVRPTVLAVPLAAVVWIAVARRRAAIASLAPYALGLALALAPVTARNWMVGHDVVPVASQGGLNYYLGNHSGADGMAALADHFRGTWTGGLEDARAQAEAAAGRALKPSEVSGYWFGRALAWAREEPGAFAALQLRKFAYFWDGFEIPNNQDYTFFAGLTRLFRWHLVLDFRVLGPLALAGLAAGLARRRLPFAWAAVPLTLAAVIVAFFVCDRFRAPLAPFFALWAGIGIVSAAEAARARERRRFLVWGVTLAAAAIWINADPWGLRARRSDAESHLRLGIFHAARGERDAAERRYRSALDANPRFADGWNNLGTLRAGAGEFAAAREAFARAIALDPAHDKALGNLAALAFRTGARAEADSLARRVLGLPGAEASALQNAAVVVGNLGDPRAARDGFTRVIALQPLHVEGRLGLARALVLLGDRTGAREALMGLPEARRTEAVRAMLEALAREP